MRRDYGEMLRFATELQYYDGYLDSEGLHERSEVENAFKGAANRFVYELLKELPDPDDASETVSRDLDALVASDEPPLQGALDEMQSYLMDRIARESRRDPRLRTAIRWSPVAIGAVILVVFFGIRWFSAVEISQPLETRAGLEQRADATRKVLRYDEWQSGSRRRSVMEILLWPIEPTEAEVKGAQEFVSLTLDGHDSLRAQGLPCRYLLLNVEDSLDDDQLALVSTVVAHVQDEKIRWRDPPVMTVLDPIRRHLRC